MAPTSAPGGAREETAPETPVTREPKRIVFDKEPTEPILLDFPLRSPREASKECPGYFSQVPDVILQFERPVRVTLQMLYPSADVKMAIFDQTGALQQCRDEVKWSSFGSNLRRDLTLIANPDQQTEYRVFFGATSAKTAGRHAVLRIYASEAKLDLFEQPFALGSGVRVPLAERLIHNFFPSMPEGFLESRDRNILQEMSDLAELFAKAPRQAFVYAKTDLDSNVAHPKSKETIFRYPRKNEPLLITFGSPGGEYSVLAADGSRMAVRLGWLLEEPDGSLALPTMKPLDANLEPIELVSFGSSRANEIWAQREAAFMEYDRCENKIWKRYEARIQAHRTARGDKASAQVENPEAVKLKNKFAEEVERTCPKSSTAEVNEGSAVLLAEIETERARLLARATARFR